MKRPFALLCALFLAPGVSGATTYVMTTDDELLERSAVVVLGHVAAVEPAPAGELPATDYLVQVERVLKGFVPASTLLVRVPGGLTEDGTAAVVWGAPRMAREGRVLLFLDERDFGVFEPVELALGVFHELVVEEERYLDRDLSLAREVEARDSSELERRRAAHLPRTLERFLDWLEQRAAGAAVEADYFVTDPVERALAAEKFAFITSSTDVFPNGCGPSGGYPARNFDFEGGRRMSFRAHQGGQPNAPGGGLSIIATAMNVWNRDSGSRIDLHYAGTTASTAPSTSSDRQNLILFEDPNGAIQGSYSGGGGTLAQTITFFTCSTRAFANGQAHPIVEADIITQDGFSSYLAGGNASLDFEEIMGHELGHAIGLAHPCQRNCSGIEADALMRGFAHGGRGARLGRDDKDAVAFLYPGAGGGGGGGGDGGGGSEPTTVPAAPGALSATPVSTSRVRLGWLDQSNDESSFEVQERTATGGWFQVETLPAGATTLEIVGIPEATFRAYRVRARNAAGASAWSNVAEVTTRATVGPCRDSANVVCLRDDRFRASATFATGRAEGGKALADRLTDDTGFFTFFNPDNVEVVLKVLDNCSGSGRFWVFLSGLTDREVIVTVADTQTGDARTYVNELGQDFPLIKDFAAFDGCP
jgi:hypothetical protein